MARRAAAARDPMGSLFFTQVKNKALSLPGPPRIWKRDKEREDTMKKKLSALLLGLALTLVLLTVTAWAAELPDAPGNVEVLQLLGKVTLKCKDKETEHKYTDFDYAAANYEVSNVTSSDDGYICTLTVLGKSFLKQFNDMRGFREHILCGNTTQTFHLAHKNGAWCVTDENFSPGSVAFQVTCAIPAAPTLEDLKNLDALKASYGANHIFALSDSLIDLDSTSVSVEWYETLSTWRCFFELNTLEVAKVFNATVKDQLLIYCLPLITIYDDGNWKLEHLPELNTAPLPDLPVAVSCGKHTSKSFTVPTQLTYTMQPNAAKFRYEYLVTLSKEEAAAFVSLYSDAVHSNHQLDSYTGTVTIWWDTGASAISANGGIAVQAATNPGWRLVDNEALSVTAACTSGGTHTGPAKNPYQQETTVTSAKTFDGGVALYAGLTLLSLTGTALTVRRKER